MNNSINNNPLFNKDYGTPHNTPPFDRVRFEHFEPAIMEAIKRDNDFIQRIVNNPDTPTFDNTIGITTPDDMLERVTKILFNLLSANTDDKLDELAQKLSPILTQHANDIIFNKPYFERVKYVYDLYNNENDKAQHQQRQLSDEETMLLRRAYEGFRRAGVELPQQKQDKLREINSQLSILTLQFSQNLLKETKAFELRIKDPKDIEGLTPTAIEAAANAAKEKADRISNLEQYSKNIDSTLEGNKAGSNPTNSSTSTNKSATISGMNASAAVDTGMSTNTSASNIQQNQTPLGQETPLTQDMGMATNPMAEMIMSEQPQMQEQQQQPEQNNQQNQQQVDNSQQQTNTEQPKQKKIPETEA